MKKNKFLAFCLAVLIISNLLVGCSSDSIKDVLTVGTVQSEQRFKFKSLNQANEAAQVVW